MGNYRFKLSDMIPNSWFRKLKDMSKTTTTGKNAGSSFRQFVKKSQSSSSSIKKQEVPFYKKTPESQPPIKPGRASYYIPSGGGCSTEDKISNFSINQKVSDTKYLADPPRKSNKKTRGGGGGGRSGTGTSTTKVVRSSVSSVCSCHATERSSAWKTECPAPPPPSLILYDDDDDESTDSLRFYDDKPVISCNNRTFTPADITIPPPIRTKQKQPNPNQKPDQKSPRRRTSAGIQRLRTRGNSPRLSTKKTTTTTTVRSGGRKGISESVAVVKSSVDPHKDFRESMVEMIAANNIRSSKDLEELLTCYLSLNSDEYHDVIVKVFERIWFELNNNGRKL